MDPVSAIGLACNVVDAIKDIYLVGKFVYRKIDSAMHHKEEAQAITEDFYLELLKLQSFGRWFEKSKGMITDDEELDRSWLEGIKIVFARLSQDFAEYRVIAAKDDADYKKLSPYLNQDRRNGILESSMKKDLSKNTGPGMFSKWLPSGGKMPQSSFFIASKWALFQKDRLERLLEKFRKRIDYLQQILPHAIHALLSQTSSRMSADWIRSVVNDPDGRRLGISKHARLRELASYADGQLPPELNLTQATIDITSNVGILRLGSFRQQVARGNETKAQVLVEYKAYALPVNGSTDSKAADVTHGIHQNAINLARLLESSGESELGTLPFRGIVNQPSEGRVAFVFDFPLNTLSNEPPESLQTIISHTAPTPWHLDIRFRTATALASTLASFHLDRWVHKNLSSNSLVFFCDATTRQLDSHRPYLVDFEFSRPETGSTARLVDGDVAKNLYRHPDIQAVDRPAFSRMHDIYSLGVVLLEIALWQTAQSILGGAAGGPDGAREKMTATQVREHYVRTARREVPHRMGSSYLRAVLACLEEENETQWTKRQFDKHFRNEVVLNLSAKALLGGEQRENEISW
ncbi:MAG: hypothetical protein M1821_007227 [Bathelium mastoideum]|nr:MAG: hypothetical protein M1821_007227 [Bathelium mastoideum]